MLLSSNQYFYENKLQNFETYSNVNWCHVYMAVHAFSFAIKYGNNPQCQWYISSKLC